jgi:hypothetical protein
MPNHITSIVHIKSVYADEDQNDYEEQEAKLKKLWQDLHTDKSDFDFNAIIPMPDNIYRGDLGHKERQEHGANNWYDWAIEHWGTKWNAYDIVYLDGVDADHIYGDILVKIETAWSPPMPVLAALKAQGFSVAFTRSDELQEWHGWQTL